MRTIELSEEKARTLAEYLAPKWADLAMRLACTNAPGNTPYRLMMERMDSPKFKSRVNRRKREAAAIGAVLEALGVQLPKPERDTLVKPWRRPNEPKAKPIELWVGGTRAEQERARLTSLIKEQIK